MIISYRKIISVIFLLTVTINAQWIPTNGPEGSVNCITVAGNKVLAGTLGSGIFATTNNGQSWSHSNEGMRYKRIWCFASESGSIYAGTIGGGVFSSADGGASWVAANNGIESESIWSLTIAKRGIGTLMLAGTGGNGVFVSEDNGASWSARSSGITDPFILALISVKDNEGNEIFLAGTGSGIFISYNKGESWSRSNSGLTNYYVWTMAAAKTQDGKNILLAGTRGGGIFASDDNGATWRESNSGLTNYSIWSITTLTAKSGKTILFVGTDNGGSFTSSNLGGRWNSINAGLASTGVRTLAATEQDLFAGTDAGGFRFPLTGIVAVEGKDEVPASFGLKQNYPNPFNPSTQISFSIPAPGNVSIAVYDLLGKEIASLLNEYRPAGNYTVQFNSAKYSLTSGVYFYRLRTAGLTETRKMILTK